MLTGMLWELGKLKQDGIRKTGYFLFYYITKSLGSGLLFCFHSYLHTFCPITFRLHWNNFRRYVCLVLGFRIKKSTAHTLIFSNVNLIMNKTGILSFLSLILFLVGSQKHVKKRNAIYFLLYSKCVHEESINNS